MALAACGGEVEGGPKTTPSDPCTKLECLHGDCQIVEDVAQCVCQAGYAGERCDTCAEGFQDNDGDGTCKPDCSLASLGCVHGACEDSSGTAVCVCETGDTPAVSATSAPPVTRTTTATAPASPTALSPTSPA